MIKNYNSLNSGNYAKTVGLNNLSEEVLSTVAQDVEYRLMEIVQDASKYMYHGKRSKLTMEDVNSALKDHGFDPMFGYQPTDPLNFRLVPNTSIFYSPVEEIDLEKELHEAPPKAPQPITITSHWLVLDGVQPAIPENPTPAEKLRNQPEPESTAFTPTLRKELQDEAEIKPLAKHILTKELQIYHDNIISDLLSNDPIKIEAALKSLSSDAGIQQLLPYMIQFVAEMIPKNMRDLSKLSIFMRLYASLLQNQHLFVEPYLHQMMPPILTCLLGKRLCEHPEAEDHWSLRKLSASLVAFICHAFGNAYEILIPRILKTLTRTLTDAEKPLTSHYGAIVGFTALGAQTIEAALIPRMRDYNSVLEETIGSDKKDSQRILECKKCREALIEAAKIWHESNPKDSETFNMLLEIFGNNALRQ